MQKSRLLGTIAMLTALAGTGCIGEITQPGESGGSGGSGATGSQALCSASPAPLRRLTNAEYDNTVLDLLGDASKPASAFPADETLYGFAAGASVSPLLAELYMNAAEKLAATAAGKLGALLPCDPGAIGEAQCATQFIEHFGKRAFRRPLEQVEVDELYALYDSERTAGEGFASSIEIVIAAVLQSPRFLYRVELGGEGTQDRVPLTSFELASRLSYFLWQTMPDEELFAAAESGELADPEHVADQARRMLADPRAHVGLRNFFDQWLHVRELEHVTKSETAYPTFDESLAASMAEETRRFVDDVLWNGDARLETLLTADYTFVNSELALLYGVEDPGSGWKKVSLDPTQRSGLLTHAGLMTVLSGADQSSPVHRGAFIRENVLCQMLPPPPENLVVVPPDPDPNLSTRERYAQHTADPACATCHQLIDPIGFGFEHYDAIGRYRTKDSGFPVDASGSIVETTDANGAFVGVPELAQKLVQSQDVQQCVARQFFRFALGRIETEGDGCVLEGIYDDFRSKGGDLRELIVAIVQSDAFRQRARIEAQEVAP
jgi:hypothetical protein